MKGLKNYFQKYFILLLTNVRTYVTILIEHDLHLYKLMKGSVMFDTEVKSNLAASPRSQIGSGCECMVFTLADHEGIVCKIFCKTHEAKLAYKRQVYAYDNGLAPRALFYDGDRTYYSEEVVPLSYSCFSYIRQIQVEEHMRKRFKALYGHEATDVHIENIGVTPDGLVFFDYGNNSFLGFETEIKTHY